MAELDLLVIAYIIVAATATMFLVPFVLAPTGWAMRADNPKTRTSQVLDKKLHEASDRVSANLEKKLGDLDQQKIRLEAAITELKLSVPNLGETMKTVEALRVQFNEIVPLINNLSGDNLVASMKQAYSDMRKAEVARGGLTGSDELTQAEKRELEAVAKNPEGKAQLNAALNLIEMAVDGGYIKGPLAKKITKQLNATFLSGDSLDAVLEPYRALFDRASGGVPSVSMVGGGGRAYTGKGPSP